MVGIQMAFSFSEFISVIMQYDFYFKKRIKTERLARKEEAEVERQYDLNKGEDEFAFWKYNGLKIRKIRQIS